MSRVRLIPPTNPIEYVPNDHVAPGVLMGGYWFSHPALLALGFTIDDARERTDAGDVMAAESRAENESMARDYNGWRKRTDAGSES